MNSRSTRKVLYWKSGRKEVVNLKIEELARLMGKTRYEMEKMLKENDVIELNLNEKRHSHREEEDELRIYE